MCHTTLPEAHDRHAFARELNELISFATDVRFISIERTVAGTRFVIFGVAALHQSFPAITDTKTVRPEVVRAPIYIDTGWINVPFTNWQFEVHGPDAHPFRFPKGGICRAEDTWHVTIGVKQNGQWKADNHFGAYRQGSQVCLIYFDPDRYICSRYCTPRWPSFSEVRDFDYRMVDQSFRSMGIALPYLVLASVAYVLASAYFTAVVVVI